MRTLRTTISLRAAPFRTTRLGTAITFRTTVPFTTVPFRPADFRTTITIGTAFAFRAASIRSSITIGASATFGTRLIRATVTLGGCCSLGARSFGTTTFRSATLRVLAWSPTRRAALNELVLRQFRLAEPFKQRGQAFTHVGGEFILGQHTITIGVQSLERRPRFRTLSASATRLTHEASRRSHPFFLSQFGFAESLEHLTDALAERFGQLVLGELAIAVLVELFEALFRIGALPAGTAHATGSGKFREVFQREFCFAEAFKRGLQPITKLLGNFIERDLAVLVLVQHFKPLLGIAAASRTTLAASTDRRVGLLFGLVGLPELVLRQ